MGVFKKLNGRLKKALKVFQGYLKEILKVFQGRLLLIADSREL